MNGIRDGDEEKFQGEQLRDHYPCTGPLMNVAAGTGQEEGKQDTAHQAHAHGEDEPTVNAGSLGAAQPGRSRLCLMHWTRWKDL